jgi:hypothetical protein
MRLMSLRWAAGVVLTGVALGLQAVYEVRRHECLREMADVLAQQCSGPLDAWVLPITLAAAVALAAVGIWRLVPPPRD